MSTPPGPQSQAAFLPYMNFNQGIRINYPADWRQMEQEAPAGFVVSFFSPPESLTDRFSENINVVLEPLELDMTAYDYAQACLRGISNGPIQFVENSEATVAGRQGYRWVYTGPLAIPGYDISAKSMQCLTVSGRKGIVVTYTAEIDKYDKFLPIIQQMCDSLEIM